ncbi:CrcB family protein [Nocardia sp. NPDC048505]|uniref:fluoride efflux transporter FluC n=1 Tax=unclassified Nocardia TaxID=2637762 RepID=UPI0033D7713A
MPADPPVDPDTENVRGEPVAAVLVVIALGGALGALGRYGLTLAWPASPGGFPWAVFTINVAGSFLLGALMVVLTEVRPAHPLTRPFLGVGVLGGFTTFSTYANDFRALLQPATAGTAALYLAGTLIAALLATGCAVVLTRSAARWGAAR